MAFYPVILGPVAPYNNLPIEPQFYQPSQFPITAIAFGITTTVTMGTSTNNVSPNYVIGQEVRLVIPPKYGSRQLNGQSGYVLSLPTTNSVEIGINSLGTDTFIPSPTFLINESKTPAQILAIGDIAGGQINSSGTVGLATYIPGSFINISP